MSGGDISDRFAGRGHVVLTASSAMEYAFEGEEIHDKAQTPPFLFTQVLIHGLETGEADLDGDGVVSVDELYDYLFEEVRRFSPMQTPGRWNYEVSGDFLVARKPSSRPAALPPELQQAMAHPIASVRLGAVEEIARLLDHESVGLQLAAKRTLQALSGDDSMRVSSAARQLLQRIPEEEFVEIPTPPRPSSKEQSREVPGVPIPRPPAIQTPHRIFVCYRREDTRWLAGRLYDRLQERYGAERVFRDTDAIGPGIKYTEAINTALNECRVLLALIGDAWLTAVDASGRRRVDAARDMVRIEIETALEKNIPIIPVLVQGARMPSEDELPSSIADLALYNASEVTDSRWDYDVEQLFRALDGLMPPGSRREYTW